MEMLPLEKLIDVIAQGVGRITKDYFIRKDIRTEIYKRKEVEGIRQKKESIDAERHNEKLKLIANLSKDFSLKEYSEKDGLTLKFKEDVDKYDSLVSIDERAKSRVIHKRTVEQENIEAITNHATKDILNTKAVSDKEVNKDWIFKFFNLAEQVSEQDMQMIWGKILAGEVKRPNSYSIRTLEILSSLTKDDALIFSKLANFAISDNNIYPIAYIFHKKHMDEFNKKELGLIYSDIMIMEDIGLISTSKSFITYKYEDYNQVEICAGHQKLVIEIREKAKEQRFPAKCFTRAGTELLNLIDKKASDEYIKKIISYVGRTGNKCKRT